MPLMYKCEPHLFKTFSSFDKKKTYLNSNSIKYMWVFIIESNIT